MYDNMNEKPNDQLISAYIQENVREIKRISTGHINQSFFIKGDNTYIIQALNKKLFLEHQDSLISNYLCYRSACEKYNTDNSDDYEFPVWLKDNEDRYFHCDLNGNIWRMYRYIPSDDAEYRNVDKYEIGRGLWKLHFILKSCAGIKSIRTVSHLHDLSYYYKEYLYQNEKTVKRISDIDKVIKNNIDKYIKIKVPAGSIIHGDAKMSNMIIREGRVAGFIDLDTIMAGSLYDDIADCVRSCCMDNEGNMINHSFDSFIKGYEDASGSGFTQDSMNLIINNIEKNRFMLGLRYYIDYLSGKGYFSEEYPGQTLNKATKLLLS